MKLRAEGKLGEICNEGSVPITTEKIIGFRQLEYTVYRGGLMRKVVLPATTGWVYLTTKRILMLDDGWATKDGTQWKTYQDVPFAETTWVRHKRLKVWVDIKTEDGKYTIAYVPYGAAARLFSWLLKEKGVRVKFEEGDVESPYAKEKWYRHPPK
ncbi:MAG: hypothetical protein E6K18_00175 [Methanobacteriota archaeon]|nr:MAG: hypothetical protein E6K18_00175 [Euryarchaeota archaeon]